MGVEVTSQQGLVGEGDRYFLVQRLDRLYLAVNQDWVSVRMDRQAIT